MGVSCLLFYLYLVVDTCSLHHTALLDNRNKGVIVYLSLKSLQSAVLVQRLSVL